jgi:hypothetical protein
MDLLINPGSNDPLVFLSLSSMVAFPKEGILLNW